MSSSNKIDNTQRVKMKSVNDDSFPQDDEVQNSQDIMNMQGQYLAQQEQQNQKVKRIHKHPREKLPESNEANLDLGGCYQKSMYCLGNICGAIRAIIPCCCCIQYPYVEVNQGQKGIFQRYGKYVSTVQAGLQFVNPCTDTIKVVSVKTQVLELQRQSCLTKDNILISLDCLVFFTIVVPQEAIFYLNDINKAVSNMAISTIRALAGHYTLQNILEKRQEISDTTKKIIDEGVEDWGLEINTVQIKDIELSDDTMTNLSMAAKERRLAMGKIILANSDLQSAKMMREAADILSSDAAMQIRYLQTVSKLAQFSKLVFIDDGGEESM